MSTIDDLSAKIANLLGKVNELIELEKSKSTAGTLTTDQQSTIDANAGAVDDAAAQVQAALDAAQPPPVITPSGL